MALSWACEVTRDNKQVIASEHPQFDEEAFETWLSKYKGDGYFIRDEGSAFDCKYMDPVVFLTIYRFRADSRPGDMFRQIETV